MEFDLTQGLRDLSRTPPVTALSADPVVRRVRRGRAIRTTAVGLASAAVVVGAAVVVHAAPWDPPPAPPATTEPTTPTPTPVSTPAPTVQPPTDEDRAIVGLTITGDVIMIDPATGEALRTVYRGLTVPQGDRTATWVSVSPDHSVAYVSHVPGFDQSQILVSDSDRVEILEISLVDGSARRIADGMAPSISPDGRTLAYVALPNSYAAGHGLNLLDLATGATSHISDPSDAFGPPSVAVWSPDGSRVYLGRPAAETSPLFVLPATAQTLDEAAQFGDCIDAGLPLFLPDGAMLMTCVDHEVHDCVHCGPEARELFEMDPGTGEVLRRRDLLTKLWSWNSVAGPTGEVAFLAEPENGWDDADPYAYNLHVSDGEGDTARRLAEDLVAIAW